jgi:FtsP/CotA-like multicopper oxidase with cupredoxin domain
MDRHIQQLLGACVVMTTLLAKEGAFAQTAIQCPGDLDGDAIPDPTLPNNQPNPDYKPQIRCMHLGAGDGFVTMADGRQLYMFGFSNLTGIHQGHAMMAGMLAASSPAPTIAVDEGDELYLTLTNVGMFNRPDLFDPHTVHWHGFPNAAPVFDGVPEAAVAINMGASLTYFYKVVQPGTYMYHCHVEATEHMQMGMVGNLYVNPAQNKLADGTVLPNGFVHQSGFTYAYNDQDGSTRYDVQAPIQLGSFDPEFHDASENVQPLPFANMRDRYATLNGRGYPDTVNPGPLSPPAGNGGKASQVVTSRVEAAVGQRILLRFSNLNVTRFYTLGSVGLPLRVIGHNARLLRGPSPDGVSPGRDLSYVTNSITLGGGEGLDTLIDTSGLSPGTYFLYAKNLNYLNNDTEDFGGMMTEIIITTP